MSCLYDILKCLQNNYSGLELGGQKRKTRSGDDDANMIRKERKKGDIGDGNVLSAIVNGYVCT